MKLFRNREIGSYMAAFLLTTAAVCICFLLTGGNAVFYLMAEGLILLGIFLICLRRRYEDMEKLTQKVDRILHGEDQLELGEYKEGDLEILKDEIYKMTVRLREQNEQLEREKSYLANALADISHQIRTPLTSLNLMVERLRRPDMEEGQKRKIYREMTGMLHMME